MKIRPEPFATTLPILLAAGAILLGLAIPLWAQFGLSLQNESGYSSNAFANYYALPDYFSSSQITVHHDWLQSSSGLRLYYQGELTLFEQYHDRNSHTHEAGFNGYKNWGASENQLDWGIRLSKSFYGDSYRWYEQEQTTSYGQIKIVASPSWFLYTGISLSYRNYPLLQPFAHFRTFGFVRSSWFFDTGTTFILETNIQQKIYSQDSQAMADTSAPEIIYAEAGNSLQGLLSLRAAQSLSANIGISAEYRVRHNWNSATRYLASSEGGYFSDEDVFDDVFAHHGQSALATYRQRLPWSMQLSINGRWYEKNYDERLAADLAGEIFPDARLRSDERRTAWLQIEKRLKLKSNLNPLKVTVTYSWLKNQSNDPLYNYKSSYWGMSLSQAL